ncbi:MAG: hypothetical protein RL662_1816 [Bacteroidota bacterium]|jgi:glutathione peroxidase
MKRTFVAFFLLFTISVLNSFAQQKSLYDFKVKDIDEQEYDLSALKGKKVLIVNVASNCGLTPQYTQLEELYQRYKNQNFVILGFPCNDFREQESGTNGEIKEFCSFKYGVTFPLMDKISVKSPNKAALYRWLTEKVENGVLDAEVQWNFQKFMIDENGQVVDYLAPKESPLSDKLIGWLE